jgi:transcriptional regulator with XRE-family HTH domain
MPSIKLVRRGDDGLRPSAVFATRLRETRVAHGLSQAELARQMRERGQPMSKAAVLRIESGERGLSLDEALAFAWVLNAAPAHLLSPPEGEYVMLTADGGVDGSGLRNWLLFGDPLLLSTEGKRVKTRMNAVFTIEALAQAIVDAKRGGDRAGVDAAALRLRDVIATHQDELEAIEREEEQ